MVCFQPRMSTPICASSCNHNVAFLSDYFPASKDWKARASDHIEQDARPLPHLIQLIELADFEEDDSVPVLALDRPVLLLGFCKKGSSSENCMTAALALHDMLCYL